MSSSFTASTARAARYWCAGSAASSCSRVLGELEPCLIGIEASTGAFYWQRQFEKLGHAVKIMAPQYVKPFVRRQKNDSNDAEAICTAVQQRNMRFVPKKTLEQQDIQALHRARQRLVNHRTALISQMRGLLLDRGIAIAVSATRARRLIPKILAAANDELTEMMREIVSSLYAFMLQIDERIKAFDRKIDGDLQSQRSLPEDRQDPRHRTEDRDRDDRGDRRWLRLQERPPSGGLAGAGPAPAFQWRSQRDDGHQQARQPALEDAARTWCPSSCPHGSEKNRFKEYVGQRTSPAARL